MITINKVSKQFGAFKAVNETSLHIQAGSIHGLLGSNGAGKTTLLKMVAGIYKVDSGEVLFDDQNIYENEAYKSQMIFISDIPYFFTNTSLKDMANFYADMYPRFSWERFNQLVELLKINPNKKLSKVSKGMKRQAAFILAIAARPNVMLLDEPFDGLDPIMRHTIKNLLIQDVSKHEMHLFVSSHNLREMEDFCDSVSIMHEGKVLLERDLDELKGDICKLQMAFKQLPNDNFYQSLNIVDKKVKGRIVTCIIKGDFEDIEQYITQQEPLMYDILPLTLEEIFAYELGGYGYAIENIIVE